MKKPILIGIVSAGVLLLSAIGYSTNQPTELENYQATNASSEALGAQDTVVSEKITPICDGETVTTAVS